jgi:hypothetical protein
VSSPSRSSRRRRPRSSPAEDIGADPSRLRSDSQVGLAFYGCIVYVAVVAALASQADQPHALSAISAVVATASVLYVAHVFSSVVPKAARAGRLHPDDLVHALRHESPLLASVTVPAAPFLLVLLGAVTLPTAYRLSVRLTLTMLFALTVALSRRDGLGWRRSILSGVVIIVVTIAITWLETHVH